MTEKPKKPTAAKKTTPSKTKAATSVPVDKKQATLPNPSAHSASNNKKVDSGDSENQPHQTGYSLLSIVLVSAVVSLLSILGTIYWWDSLNYVASKNIPQWQNKVSAFNGALPKNNSASNDETTAQLLVLEEKLNNLSIAQSESPAANEVKLKERMASLETSLAQLAKKSENNQELETLQQELMNTERSIRSQIQTMEQSKQLDFRLLIAFQQLQSRALSGRDFSHALQSIKTLAITDATLLAKLDELNEFAKTGRVELGTLKQNFNTSISQMQQDEQAQDESFSGKVKQNLSQFIKIRHVSGEGSSNDALLARAENQLAEGNVDKALEEINNLPEDAQTSLAEWKTQAQAYNKVPSLLNSLEVMMAGKLATIEKSAE